MFISNGKGRALYDDAAEILILPLEPMKLVKRILPWLPLQRHGNEAGETIFVKDDAVELMRQHALEHGRQETSVQQCWREWGVQVAGEERGETERRESERSRAEASNAMKLVETRLYEKDQEVLYEIQTAKIQGNAGMVNTLEKMIYYDGSSPDAAAMAKA